MPVLTGWSLISRTVFPRISRPLLPPLVFPRLPWVFNPPWVNHSTLNPTHIKSSPARRTSTNIHTYSYFVWMILDLSLLDASPISRNWSGNRSQTEDKSGGLPSSTRQSTVTYPFLLVTSCSRHTNSRLQSLHNNHSKQGLLQTFIFAKDH